MKQGRGVRSQELEWLLTLGAARGLEACHQVGIQPSSETVSIYHGTQTVTCVIQKMVVVDERV